MVTANDSWSGSLFWARTCIVCLLSEELDLVLQLPDLHRIASGGSHAVAGVVRNMRSCRGAILSHNIRSVVYGRYDSDIGARIGDSRNVERRVLRTDVKHLGP